MQNIGVQDGVAAKVAATLTSLSLPFKHWDGLDWGTSSPPTGHVPLKKWDGMDWFAPGFSHCSGSGLAQRPRAGR